MVHTPYRETVVHNCRNLNDVRRLLVSKIFDLRKSFFLLVFLLGPPWHQSGSKMARAFAKRTNERMASQSSHHKGTLFMLRA